MATSLNDPDGGELRGHQRGENMAVYGEKRWPPVGRTRWPLTRISIDFTVPTFPAAARDQAAIFPLPLALLDKQKLTRFDLRDASAASVPMLTAAENADISASVLLVLSDFRGLAYRDPILQTSIVALVSATNDSERAFHWNRIFDTRITLGRHLLEQQDFVTLAREFAGGFVLYIPVTNADVGKRRILKMGFDSPKPAVRPENISGRLGWSPVNDRFPVPLAGYASSYHFEVQAPPDMVVVRGEFVGIRSGAIVTDPLRTAVECAHFNLAALDRRLGLVVVSLSARARELLGGVFILAAANALAQAVVLFRLHEIRTDHSVDPVVAVLLALPGVLLSYVVRPGEHRILAGFLSGVRRAAQLCAATSFGAAITVFGGFSAGFTRAVMIVLVAVAASCAAILAGSWGLQRR